MTNAAKDSVRPPSNGNGGAALEAGLKKRLSSVDPKTRRKIEDWAKRLVDLSRRNRLLYYRPTKRTTLTFLQPSPDAIYTRLVDGGSFTFYRPPELPPLIPGRPRQVTPLDDELARRRPLEREIVTTQRDPVEIERSLEAIDRKARAEFEDRGTHVLYFAWNLLQWRDPKTGEEQSSPLVLVPLELSRSSVTEPYQVRAASDGDPFLNPALRVKLEVDFSMALPDVDLDDLHPIEIADQIGTVVPQGWGIQPHAAMGIFGFAKEAMYRDLVDHAEVVARHPVVQSMVHGQITPALAKALSIDVPAARVLDQNEDPGYSVVDADSSQRRAIEAANRGLSFVLHGPPGTGKSQTITNIIAEFIGRGMSVLFVSQKMAALEVVAKRLEEVDLRDLALELHSAKASRGDVARALAQALDSHPKPDDSTVASTTGSLRANRAVLNDYVDTLHSLRQPLGISAFDVLAELTTLASVPAIEGPGVEAGTATLEHLSETVRRAERLHDAWLPVEEGSDFPWWNVVAPVGSAAERERVKDALLRTREAVVELEILDRQLCGACEWPMPDGQDERRAHDEFGAALSRRRPAPLEWLTADDLSPYAALLARCETPSARHNELTRTLESRCGTRWRELSPGRHQELTDSFETLANLLGEAPDWDRLADSAAAIADASQRLPTAIADTLDVTAKLARYLGLTPGTSLGEAKSVIRVARMSQERHRPPSDWLSRVRLAYARAFLEEHRPTYVEQQLVSASLLERYDKQIIDLDLDPLIDRMRRWHGGWWNRLRRQHRADRAAVMAVTRSRALPPTVLDDLELARQVREMRAEIDALETQSNGVLGPYSRGPETDPAAIEEAASAAERLLSLPTETVDWAKLSATVTVEAPYDPEIERQADAVESALARVESTLRVVTTFATAECQAEQLDWEREHTSHWTDQVRSLLLQVMRIRDDLTVPGQSLSIAQAQELARDRHEVDQLETDWTETEPVLREALRSHYQGFGTDWASLTEAVTWAAHIRTLYGGELPEIVARDVQSGTLGALPWAGHAGAVTTLDRAVQRAAAVFNDGVRASVTTTLTGDAATARAWIDQRLARIDDLGVWDAYRSALTDFEQGGWGSFVTEAVERRTSRADLAPASRRAWLESWFASLAAAEPTLRLFSRPEHERIAGLFQVNDQRSVVLGRERVLRKYAEQKPPPATVQGGEQAIVRKEALKKRRHLPVRALLQQLPTLLPKIKPCLMMSPLSVSHFLSANATFDLVVFDEASQVPPEDAVNCIYRGRQLIVAGDPMQLPPTDFFQLSALSEEDGEFEEDIGDFESVLDLCRGIGLPPFLLDWHYRSRHDALIAFSNHYIYDSRLVTFPAPYQHSSELGVSFIHVPDATFDRGKSASNPVEARKVVDVVIDHWTQHPEESIGVVAFSVAQQDAVLDEMARRVSRQPELERHHGAGRLDAFFVKNLETVQGDERDVIAFTIGYGRDEQGRFYHNFGALNRPGGARRLNVAVTRARRRVVVVSSIKAADLRLPDATANPGSLPHGGALLRAYLDYAERGVLPVSTGDAPSDGLGRLELDVAQVVRDLGFDVVERVGTSRYRVDLGVASKVEPGRLALGIECDGAMYRDAETARDRDRLRDAVLRGLGWRIHRIWAPAWYFSRQEEIQHLRSAIAVAEQSVAEASASSEQGRPDMPEDRRPRDRVETPEIRVEGPQDAVHLGWATHYALSKVPPYSVFTEFHDWSISGDHAERVAAIVNAEGPVHERAITDRLMRAFGLARAGNRIQEATKVAIAQAERGGKVRRRGAFVWPVDTELTKVRVPAHGRAETLRPVEHIPPEELELALLWVADTAGTIDPATLRVTVSRIFGFERTGERIDDTLQVRLNSLLAQKRLAMSAGSVILGPKAALPKDVRPAVGDRPPEGWWIRHPRLGVGRVLSTTGTVVTIDFGGQEKRIDTKFVELVPVPKPQ